MSVPSHNRLHPVSFAAEPMSRVRTEEVAETILRRMFPENLDGPVRLDVVRMMDDLEQALGVTVGVEDLPSNEEGYTNYMENEIVIDTRVYKAILNGDGRARQTFCHEVGHVPHIRQVRSIIRDGAPRLARSLNVLVPAYRSPEWQAHAIGAALLMPKSTVPDIYHQGGFEAIAEFFQVSRRSAEVRVSVLQGLKVL